MSSKRNSTQQVISRSFLFFLIVTNFSLCSQKEANPEQKLLGTWNRTDGDYFLVINQVEEEGQMEVEYLNPSPINVGRSAWRINEDWVQIYVELRDENYPGSLYQLNYDAASDQLTGTYYQAVARQTYEVRFARKE
jgi:hypothetical protein